jgi:hypothetical protein
MNEQPSHASKVGFELRGDTLYLEIYLCVLCHSDIMHYIKLLKLCLNTIAQILSVAFF